MRLDLSKSFMSGCDCPPEGLQLEINTPGGHLCTLIADCRSRIDDLKEKIEHATGIPRIEQRLLTSEGEVKDCDLLTSSQKGFSNLLLLRRDSEQAQWLWDIASGAAWSLQDAPAKIRNDRDVVVAAVHHIGYNLIYASEELRADKEIALLASRSPRFGSVFQHLSKDLRADRELLLTALQHSSPGDALSHAADELRNDKSIVLDAVRRHHWQMIRQAPIHLQEDPDVILTALRQHRYIGLGGPGCYTGCTCCGGIPCPPRLLHDKAFVFEAACLGQVNVLHLAFHENANQNWGSDQDFMFKLVPVIYLAYSSRDWPVGKYACFRCHGRCRSALAGPEVRSVLEKMRVEEDNAVENLHTTKARLDEARLRSRLRDRARCARSNAKTQREGHSQHRLKRGGRHKVRELDHWDF